MDPKIQSEIKQKMDKGIEALKHEFSRLRTGRASVGLVDGVKVEYYGSTMPLNQVATVNVTDSRTLTLSPWDKSAIQEIERAIHKADLGLQPVNDGKVIRINIPALTEERRKDLVKIAKKVTEESRVTIRNIRREGNESIKKLQKEAHLSEDDLEKWEAEVQKMTDAAIAQLDSLLTHKEKEIMEV
ncbi:MAG: ribosome recycling factor [Deltaproteobacteria bacterium]|nr:MAG: ribosome recycling factor [Deltaproteobacteria bacterium]